MALQGREVSSGLTCSLHAESLQKSNIKPFSISLDHKAKRWGKNILVILNTLVVSPVAFLIPVKILAGTALVEVAKFTVGP